MLCDSSNLLSQVERIPFRANNGQLARVLVGFRVHDFERLYPEVLA